MKSSAVKMDLGANFMSFHVGGPEFRKTAYIILARSLTCFMPPKLKAGTCLPIVQIMVG